MANISGQNTVQHVGVNPSNAELNPICHLLALLGAHHILHVSRIRVKHYICRTPTMLNSIKLTFIGPRIVIYFYGKPNRCISFSDLFIAAWHSTCFVRSFRPSSGVQDCTYSNRYMSERYGYLLASKQVAVPVWHMPVAVCTVLNSWWWTERPYETCRVSCRNK
jgi:hypothetical protein